MDRAMTPLRFIFANWSKTGASGAEREIQGDAPKFRNPAVTSARSVVVKRCAPVRCRNWSKPGANWSKPPHHPTPLKGWWWWLTAGDRAAHGEAQAKGAER